MIIDVWRVYFDCDQNVVTPGPELVFVEIEMPNRRTRPLSAECKRRNEGFDLSRYWNAAAQWAPV
jgi:hypothetical protein